MLSSPVHNTQSSALQSRRRLHQRQKSMPVAAFEAMKMSASAHGVPPSPSQTSAQAGSRTHSHARTLSQQQAYAAATGQMAQPQQLPRQMSHRRGISLDTRRQQIQQRQQSRQQMQSPSRRQSESPSESPSQDQSQDEFVGAPANALPGTPNTTPQHGMQETQTQSPVCSGLDAQEQQQQQQQECSAAASFDYYNGPAAAMMRKTLSGSGLPLTQQDFQLFASQQQELQAAAFLNFPDTSLAAMYANAARSPQGWASEEETSSTRRTSRRVSNGILDRVSKFECMAALEAMQPQRPATPPPSQSAYFPPTPTETPLEKMQNLSAAGVAPRLDRFADEYDTSMEETIKPVRRRGHQSNHSSGVFDDLRQQAETMAMVNAAQPGMMQMQMQMQMPEMPMNSADFLMDAASAEFLKMQQPFMTMPVPADLQHTTPPQTQQPTPASVQGVFDNHVLGTPGLYDGKSDLWGSEYDAQATLSPSYSYAATPTRHRGGHRRNESMASLASAASIASINIDETRTATGVTTDDIAAYIEGPNPADGKWRCTFEGCDKRFGRKENIKSHVQTHLNDRQYQCPHCHKCFVRQHDLKRHAKIHTGIKPYPCECGNNFARHDALTRHRQRGMCIGAFDGAVRKVGKRGRPRKPRPSLDLRREKSTRTRTKNAKTSPETSSPETSNSENSDNSDNSPRSATFDDDVFFDEALDAKFSDASGTIKATMNPNALSMSSAPMPGAGAASPSAMSQHSDASHASHASHTSRHSVHIKMEAASPAKSVGSHYTANPGTPPELSASSSPPRHESPARFFELDPNSSCTEDDSLLSRLSAPLTESCGPLGLELDVDGLPSAGLEDELMMKGFSTDDVLVQMDSAGLEMLGASKYDDEYGLFSSDDVFFDSH